MFESLPQLSLTTRETANKEANEFSKLSESEMQNQVENELSQLAGINTWIAGGARATAYCIQQVDELVQHDRDTPEEVKAFWGTFGPYLKVRVLKATLILLQAVDKELWAKDMEAKMKDAGEVSGQ